MLGRLVPWIPHFAVRERVSLLPGPQPLIHIAVLELALRCPALRLARRVARGSCAAFVYARARGWTLVKRTI